VVNLADLTAVRAMEEEIRRLDRLAALGRFAAGVAHEIRNPLAGIGAGVEYLGGRIGPEGQEDLRFLRSEIRRLDRIVSDMLDYTRPRPLEPQPLEAGSLLERVRQLLAPVAAGRQVDLALEAGEDRLLVWADPERLEQVLLNLVKNAIEASPEGGRVRVSCEHRSRGLRPGESLLAASGFAAGEGGGAPSAAGPEGGLRGEPSKRGPPPVRFRVADEGRGMAPAELARAFEPFFTTKGNGTGLGLALSHAIVEQHGGRLLLESAPGRGTVAVLELPGGVREGWEEDAVVHSHR
jgi:two-component system sensor histidine kinase HydH